MTASLGQPVLDKNDTVVCLSLPEMNYYIKQNTDANHFKVDNELLSKNDSLCKEKDKEHAKQALLNDSIRVSNDSIRALANTLITNQSREVMTLKSNIQGRNKTIFGLFLAVILETIIIVIK